MPHAIIPEPAAGFVSYLIFPGTGVAPVRGRAATGLLAPELDQLARRLRGLGTEQAVSDASAWLRGRLDQPLDEAMLARHREAAQRGIDFQTAALDLGSGDCDVRNALLARVLSVAGIESRLALGFPSDRGRALPWLHAWVEYRDGPGNPWRVADASAEAAQPRVALPAPSSPVAPLVASGPPPQPLAAIWPSPTWATLGVVVGLCCCVALVLLGRSRRARTRLDDRHDLSALLGGALAHPEAWRDAPELFDRRLLPLCAGGKTSLRAAWGEAARGRLFLARAPHALARRAGERGLSVLDASAPEARLVGRALGAVDLDDWDRCLREGRAEPVLEAACRALERRGETIVARSGGGFAALELPGSGVRGGAHYLVVPRDAAWLATARRLMNNRPATAVVLAADALLEMAGREPEAGAEVLAPMAREALLEEARA
jgi:hypothetical protein